MQRLTYHCYQLLFRLLLLGSVCSALTLTVVAQEPVGKASELQRPPVSTKEDAAMSTKAEAGLYSEAVVIEEQAQQAQLLKGGENLLPAASGTPTSEKQTKKPKP